MRRVIKLFSVTCLLAFYGSLYGQEKYVLPSEYAINQVVSSRGEISGTYSITHFTYRLLYEEGEKFLSLNIPGSFPSGSIGEAKIPVFSQLVEIDKQSSYRVNIQSIDSIVIDMSVEFPDCRLLLAKASVQKSIKEGKDEDAEYFYSEPEKVTPIISIEREGTMRGVSLGRLQFHPMRYHPEENTLVIYHSIHFTASQENQNLISEGNALSEPFARAMASVVRDKSLTYKKRLTKEEVVSMVILSDTMFRASLQPLIEWKIRKGFRIIEAYTSDPDVGSTPTEIKNYLSNLYHYPPEGYSAPSYLLIAGDVEHVPLSQSSGQITDLYYTTFDGEDDYLPEMFHGRISVKNDTQMTNVVNKILMYEKYEFPDPSFLTKSILIAGSDPSYAAIHGNGQIRYAQENYFNETNQIIPLVYLHPEASDMDKEIYNNISQGAAFVNYTGHGDENGWINPTFRTGQLDTLNNANCYPLMIGNGCRTNQFNLSTKDCFAEAVLKIKDKGAIGYIGCTNDSYWDEDYFWTVGVGTITSFPEYENTSSGFYDKLFHQGNEPVEDWCPSLGEMIFAGNMTVQQSSSPLKKYYWEIYQLMGDPSLVPWFSVPEKNNILYPESIPVGSNKLSISASPYNYIAISVNGGLIVAQHADRYGQAYISLPDSLEESDLYLVVTGDRKETFLDTIRHTDVSAGYLELDAYQIVEESILDDGLISEGETFSLDISLINTSNLNVEASKLILECKENFITIRDSVVDIAALGSGEKLMLNAVFMVEVSDSVRDNNSFKLKIKRSQVSVENSIYLKETVHTSEIYSGGIKWEDQTYGNGNGIPEADEKLVFSWDIFNRGTYQSDSLIVKVYSPQDTLFSNFVSLKIGGIPTDVGQEIHFIGAFKELKPADEKRVGFTLMNGKHLLRDSVFIVTGRHFEDFSRGSLSKFFWMTEDGGWYADSSIFRDGPFSVRSAKISNSSQTSLQIEVDLQSHDSIKFDLKVSSESGYDYLKFFVDDVLIDRWSGLLDWERYSCHLDSGRHVMEWRYQKDSNLSKGEDAAWLDNISFPAHSFDSLDIGIIKILSPVDGKALGTNEELRVLIENQGQNEVNTFKVGFKLNNFEWIFTSVTDAIAPGEKIEVVFPERIDLSEIAKYSLIAEVHSSEDKYPGNDTLMTTINHYLFPDISIMDIGIDSVVSEYTDLIVKVTNEGNTDIENWEYTYYLDSELKEEGIVPLALSPGTSAETTIRLLSSEDDSLKYGTHDYHIVSLPDSVLWNNSIEGSVFWNPLSIEDFIGLDFEVYPNPLTREFVIYLPSVFNLPLGIEFLSMDGKIIKSIQTNNFENRYNVREIFSKAGNYIVRIRRLDGKFISARKIMVQ